MLINSFKLFVNTGGESGIGKTECMFRNQSVLI